MIMNTQRVMSKLIGTAGAAVMSVAFVSLFASMGASGNALAKAELSEQTKPVYLLERVEVVAHRDNTMAMNTHGVKARTL
jgi:hypothetical protein